MLNDHTLRELFEESLTKWNVARGRKAPNLPRCPDSGEYLRPTVEKAWGEWKACAKALEEHAQEKARRTLSLTRVNSDTYGNPRYVVHFLALSGSGGDYAATIRKARKIGGGKFHNKQYGGGVVFQSHNVPDIVESVNEEFGTDYLYYEVD